MSLKEDYSGVCTGGFDSDMMTVYQAGVDYVGTLALPGIAYPQLSTALMNSAGAGIKNFTASILVTFEPDNLKLGGIHQQTYFAGIIDALTHEGIYSMYVALSLNTTNTVDLKVDFNFTM